MGARRGFGLISRVPLAFLVTAFGFPSAPAATTTFLLFLVVVVVPRAAVDDRALRLRPVCSCSSESESDSCSDKSESEAAASFFLLGTTGFLGADLGGGTMDAREDRRRAGCSSVAVLVAAMLEPVCPAVCVWMGQLEWLFGSTGGEGSRAREREEDLRRGAILSLLFAIDSTRQESL